MSKKHHVLSEKKRNKKNGGKIMTVKITPCSNERMAWYICTPDVTYQEALGRMNALFPPSLSVYSHS